MTTLERLTNQRNITTITFDMDDTLWDFQAAMGRALELTLERLRVMAPGDAARKLTVRRMMEIRDEVASELGEGATTQEEIRYTAMVRTVEHVGFRARGAAEELYRLYWEARVAGARPYDDVAGVLEALQGRFRLGIISNGNNTPQMVGLDDVFDFTVFAHECGFPKPDPRIFEFALAGFGDKPDSVAHVGDSLQSDVLGANNYGMLSVWLNRDGVANETGITPHREIGNLTELLDIL
ncbi:MAG: HAD family hydrolase [Chloroflexota bacterium]|nr:HAD family hydrolase [Chloroflexota bacterium]MDE2683748.1 HAD family hydrolase [Chloroflexota bacterium]